MSDVIKWAIVGGNLVFALGLISAFGSRYKERKAHAAQAGTLKGQYPRRRSSIEAALQEGLVSKNENGSAAAAIHGVANGEDALATVCNSSS